MTAGVRKIYDSTGAPVEVKPIGASGAEAAVNTGAAAVELVAAVASKRHFITHWWVTNITAGEFPIAVLQDDAGTPVKHAHMAPMGGGTPAATVAGATREMRFDPPLEVASGQAVDYALQSATGDCHSGVRGYVEI